MNKGETPVRLATTGLTASAPTTSTKPTRGRVTPKPLPKFEPLLTVEETAVVLNTSTKTVRRRIRAGELPAVRDGRLLRVRPIDLRTYIAAAAKPPKGSESSAAA